MDIKNQKEHFNNTYENWKDVSDEKSSIINRTISLLGISEGHAVLDVASGTGVLYADLREIKLSNYVALDISENMLKELKQLYPEAKTMCADFDKEIELEDKFDYIIIFNSIPHFENLDVVFSNAKKHLKSGGTFAIVHARTRSGLKGHHKKIGYSLGREAIPSDDRLNALVKKYEFGAPVIKDEDFFYFSCASLIY